MRSEGRMRILITGVTRFAGTHLANLALRSYSAAQCEEMSLGAHEAAVTDFSEAAFRQNMTDAIQHVISLSSGSLCGENIIRFQKM